MSKSGTITLEKIEETVRAVMREFKFIPASPGEREPAKPSREPRAGSPFQDRVLDFKLLRELVPYSKPHLRRMWEKDKFPRPFKIGIDRLAWKQSVIEQWLKDRVAERGAPDPAQVARSMDGVRAKAERRAGRAVARREGPRDE